MAVQTVEFIAANNLTLSAKLFSQNSDTVVQEAESVIESTNRKGVYLAVFNNVPAGTYLILAFSGASSVALWEVSLTLSTSTFIAYDRLSPASIRASIGMATSNLDSQLNSINNNISASSSPILYPIFTKTPDRISDSKINLFYNEDLDVNIVIVDSDGNLIDVTSKVLKIVIEDDLGQDIKIINDQNIIKSNGNININIDEEVTSKIGQYKYSVRDITNKNTVLTYGIIDVQYTPESGSYPS